MPSSPKCRSTKLSDAVVLPTADVTHLFNHEAMLAVSHAIEDVALDTAEGELISTCLLYTSPSPRD